MTLRSLSALVLALMLALTGQSMAVARGASAAMGQMVLCTGAGPVAIYVDAQGKPTSAPHICPDSALNVAMSDAVALVAAPMRIVVFDAPSLYFLIADVPRRKTRHDPRAPPVVV
ncbi:hypothetical protein [Sulfitobacter litoralis]|uniref:hypothetical protein n=1 Tax=Sulfitobacter litoralis TaxID=335975 RepID=UPI002B27458E|nr:hypothetical protein [Sulfitobacter litoralis]